MAMVVAALWLAMPAAAQTSSPDARATDGLLVATSRLELRVLAQHTQELTAEDRLITHIQTTCPQAIPGRLRSGSAADLAVWLTFSLESVSELGLSELQPVRPALWAFVARLSPLTWTSQALNRSVAALTHDFASMLEAHPPDLCGQARAARASGFTHVPSATGRFLATLSVPPTSARSSDVLGVILRQIKPDGGAW